MRRQLGDLNFQGFFLGQVEVPVSSQALAIFKGSQRRRLPTGWRKSQGYDSVSGEEWGSERWTRGSLTCVRELQHGHPQRSLPREPTNAPGKHWASATKRSDSQMWGGRGGGERLCSFYSNASESRAMSGSGLREKGYLWTECQFNLLFNFNWTFL